MTKRFFTILVFIIPVLSFGQSKKPEVLIYGSGIDAYTAAVQSAMSGLNTIWISDNEKLVPELTTTPTTIEGNKHLDSGIWATFLAKTLQQDKRSDSLSEIAKRRLSPQIAANAINDLTAVHTNLTVIKSTPVKSIKRSGKTWQVELNNRVRYKVRAVVDGSADGGLHKLAYPGIPYVSKTTVETDYFEAEQYLPLQRTGVAVATKGSPFTLPLATLIPGNADNFFVTRISPTVHDLLSGDAEDIPLLAHVGQVIGAAASYTAFFRTTSDKIDLRKVQGEILQYGSRLLPFQDIPIESPHLPAIQRIGATGIFDGFVSDTAGFYFHPDLNLSTAEIAPVLNQLFSRSQIWFIDNSMDTMTMADLLSLIKHIGHKGNELEGQLEKYWTRRFYFDGEYDLEMPATRRHFAVLFDTYCKPFDVQVGLDGSIQR